MGKKSFAKRLLMYFGGLLSIAFGIAVSVKSNLGVSPVSSIPYTMTCVIGLELGKATMAFHALLVGVQAVLLGKKFKWISLLQILVGVVFGYFTTFCNTLVAALPIPEVFAVRILLALISTVFIALGLFFYVPANVMSMASEGVMLAVSQKFGIEFANAKIGFDVTVVVISLVICLLTLHTLGSVGIGTLISAFLVGIHLKWMKKIGQRLRKTPHG